MKLNTQVTTDRRVVLTERDLISLVHERLRDTVFVPQHATVHAERKYNDDGELTLHIVWSEIEEVA